MTRAAKSRRLTDRILRGLARAVRAIEAGPGEGCWTDAERLEINHAADWLDEMIRFRGVRAQRRAALPACAVCGMTASHGIHTSGDPRCHAFQAPEVL
jgi:hypothetical protein